MQIEININELLYPTLERISSSNGLSPENYAQNIVQTFLERQYRGEVLDEIKGSTVEELDDIKNKLKNKKK